MLQHYANLIPRRGLESASVRRALLETTVRESEGRRSGDMLVRKVDAMKTGPDDEVLNAAGSHVLQLARSGKLHRDDKRKRPRAWLFFPAAQECALSQHLGA